MAKHTLSLEIQDTLNDCVLSLMDTSIYGKDVPIECPYIDILAPGFSCSVRIEVKPHFCLLNLTACDLNIQREDCGYEFYSLPDGIYSIKYSVSPNEYIFVEYNHLRITNFMKKYNDILCSLDLALCDPLPEIKEKLKELRLIEMLVKAAKAKVEICHKPKQGMDLYDYAKKRLDKLSCSTCI